MTLLQLVSALFVVAATGVWGGVAFTQENDTRWLVGVWEGTTTMSASQTRVTVEFKNGGNFWELEIASGACTGSKARGSAKVSGNAVEMKGEYYQPTGPCRPTSLSFSLTRVGDVLEGTGIGAANRPAQVSWKKVR